MGYPYLGWVSTFQQSASDQPSRGRRSRPKTIRTMLAAAVGMFALFIGVAGAATFSVEVIDRTGFATDTLNDGSVVEYIGDQNTTFGASGSGIFDSFVRLQATGEEAGYNTDGPLEFDTKSGAFTHSILVSEIPVIEVDGQLYMEFFADINDSDSTPLISLDAFEIYFTSDPAITGYPFAGTATAAYLWNDPADYIRINDVNQGSGRGDLRYLVNLDAFLVDIPDDCDYGNTACMTYLVLHSEWGGLDGYDSDGSLDSDGGFEEWKVKRYPILGVSKTIVGEYDRTVEWEITKTTDATYDLFVGDPAVTHNYTIEVDKTETLGDTTVSGVITIVGDTKSDGSDRAATDVDADLSDVFEGSAATITGCSVPQNADGTYTIAANTVVTCDYTLDLTGPTAGTNVATANVQFEGAGLVFVGDADIAVDDYSENLTGEDSITVDDDTYNDGDFTADDDKTVNYSIDYDCSSVTIGSDGSGSTTVVNTATITETGDSDDATVTVNCYQPSVAKTAAGTNDETHTWEITKEADATYDLFPGESVDHDYTISVTETVVEDNYNVTGAVTVTNPHPTANADVTLVDTLSDGTVVGFTDCADADPGTPGIQVSAAPGDTVCSYDVAEAGDDGDATKNTVTMTHNGADQVAEASFTYVANVIGPDSINVDDDTYDDGDFSTGVSTSETYTVTYDCSSVTYDADGKATFDVTNTATIVETSQSDSATVTVNCYLPQVSKTADGTFIETRDWDIVKETDGDYDLLAGDSVTHDYTFTLGTSVTNGGYEVTGAVTVDNPHPTNAALVTLVDTLDDGTAVTLDCLDEDAGTPGTQVTAIANGSTVCTYTTGEDGDDGNATKNMVTMSFGGINQMAEAPFTYVVSHGGAQMVNVSDVNDATGTVTFGPFGPGDAGTPVPYNETYTCPSDPSVYVGGKYSIVVNNTATIDETGDNDSAVVTIDCWLPTVSKTANTSFTRTYNWVIDKEAFLANGDVVPATGLELAFGQSYDLMWEVVVGLDPTTPSTDSDWAVEGVITVNNPSPLPMTVFVSDIYNGGAPWLVSCPDDLDGLPDTYTIAAGGSVDCTYGPQSLTDGSGGTNVATATITTAGGPITASSAPVAVDFSDAVATITEVNATVVVHDSFQGGAEVVLGTVTAADVLATGPVTFPISTMLSSDPTDTPDWLLVCGMQDIVNAARVLNFDTGVATVELAADTRTVPVNVVCDFGCTLTQGYWKTHNDSFWGGAPTDETWDMIGPLAEQEMFFLSGQTYFDVMHTPAQGNPYYQLAKQYIAAVLNGYNGADTSVIAAELAAAEDFFLNNTPEDGADLKGKKAKDLRTLANTLDDYNNGRLGVPHCDEDRHSAP